MAVRILAALLVFVAGFAVGRWTSPTPEDPAPVVAAETPSPRPAARFRKESEDLRKILAARTAELDALKKKMALSGQVANAQEAVIGDLSTKVTGVPPVWSPEVPADRSPVAFEQTLEEVAEDCGFSEAVVDVDCREPPCLAVLRLDQVKGPSPRNCPAWKEQWGNTTSNINGIVDCGDGEVPFLMIGPAVQDWIADPNPEEPFNFMKRFEVRKQEAHTSICGG